MKECQEKQMKTQLENGTSVGVSIQSSLTNGVGRKENNNWCVLSAWPTADSMFSDFRKIEVDLEQNLIGSMIFMHI